MLAVNFGCDLQIPIFPSHSAAERSPSRSGALKTPRTAQIIRMDTPEIQMGWTTESTAQTTTLSELVRISLNVSVPLSQCVCVSLSLCLQLSHCVCASLILSVSHAHCVCVSLTVSVPHSHYAHIHCVCASLSPCAFVCVPVLLCAFRSYCVPATLTVCLPLLLCAFHSYCVPATLTVCVLFLLCACQ